MTMDALLVTPVKDSPETTRRTIEAVAAASGNFEYLVFDDFSGPETRQLLREESTKLGFTLIDLADHTSNPSPNYKLVLTMAQQKALEYRVPLILIESDVVIRPNTITGLLEVTRQAVRPGLIGVITVNEQGEFNFPYSNVRKEATSWSETSRSLSFCCTLISREFLDVYDFKGLPSQKDWFDIHISRQSRKLRFKNYLVRENGVLHLPHSSRPWKQLKYTHPLKYYFYKLLNHRDRI
ncbi:MAG TPA: glycosyltransferase [Prolixibacteraceae bacterium]|jgi:glycosyltransferase involved in cell wall biosynthesis|nr:glycosyltransferase family 2 protein [Bacteroidales bacterium]HPJ78561.1 glycosyltransferase [Prolixibacteraceae bacterium]HRV89920.1 glycosyltransferase [Prolixibacteraceae bacterium]